MYIQQEKQTQRENVGVFICYISNVLQNTSMNFIGGSVVGSLTCQTSNLRITS